VLPSLCVWFGLVCSVGSVSLVWLAGGDCMHVWLYLVLLAFSSLDKVLLENISEVVNACTWRHHVKGCSMS
jgi:hypothetical protein